MQHVIHLIKLGQVGKYRYSDLKKLRRVIIEARLDAVRGPTHTNIYTYESIHIKTNKHNIDMDTRVHTYTSPSFTSRGEKVPLKKRDYQDYSTLSRTYIPPLVAYSRIL